MRKFHIYTPEEYRVKPVIDVTRDTAIYVRQSDDNAAEKRPFSRANQLKLVQFAMQLRGETTDLHIRVYDEKDGVSGQVPIDKRPKIKALYDDIARGEIGSVLVISPDRLFRDKYGIQFGTFLEIADKNRVTVFESMRPPAYTAYDCTTYEGREALNRKFLEARAYLENQVYGKMCGALEEKALMGLYYGQALAPGYVVLRDAPKMEQKLIIYDPWAEKVRWMSRRFKEMDFATLCREIAAMPYLYPDPTEEDKLKYFFKMRTRHMEGGYKPHADAVIKYTLCNPTYIGCAIWKNQIIGYDVHPAILDKAEFMENLYRLTGRDLEGNPVDGYRIRLRESAPAQGVLKHTLTSPHGTVYTVNQDDPQYNITLQPEGHRMRYLVLYCVKSRYLDHVFLDRLKAVAEADEHLAEHIQSSIKELVEKHRADNASLETQLAQCKAKITNLNKTIKDLDGILPLEDKIEYAKELAGLRQEEKRILASQQKADDTDLQKDFDELADVLADVAGTIDNCPIHRLQKLARLTTTKIVLEQVSPHWLRFAVTWRGPLANRSDVCMIWRNRPHMQPDFASEEDDILRQMYPTAPMRDICKALPNRTPGAVNDRGHALAIERLFKQKRDSLPINVCWQDIEAIGGDEKVFREMLAETGRELTPFWLYAPGFEDFPANCNTERSPALLP